MLAGLFDGPEVIVVLVVVLVLFGGSRIPKLAKNLGQAGQQGFRRVKIHGQDWGHGAGWPRLALPVNRAARRRGAGGR